MYENEAENVDHYSEFLKTWEPPETLLWATNALNLGDSYGFHRMMTTGSDLVSAERAPFIQGTKNTTEDEEVYRKLSFFKETQDEWSQFFKERLLDEIDEAKVNIFLSTIANDWVDGKRARHSSANILSLKASIQNHDLCNYGATVKRFVGESIPASINPLFTVFEMEKVYQINSKILEVYLGKYLSVLNNDQMSSISRLMVRRGIFVGQPPDEQFKELNTLSSYSLGLSVAEQFAVTYTPETKKTGTASILGTAFPEVQDRVIAFAPLIPGMEINQLELILPPPVTNKLLKCLGTFDGITEYLILNA